jgi:hypothetical protein
MFAWGLSALIKSAASFSLVGRMRGYLGKGPSVPLLISAGKDGEGRVLGDLLGGDQTQSAFTRRKVQCGILAEPTLRHTGDERGLAADRFLQRFGSLGGLCTRVPGGHRYNLQCMAVACN